MNLKSLEERDRPVFLVFGAAAAAIFLLLGLAIFDSDSRTSALLFDLTGKLGVFPFTVQGLMWLVFFLALADAMFIYLSIGKDKAGLSAHFLPEEKTKMISNQTAKNIYSSISTGLGTTSAVSFLVAKTLDQFFVSSSLSRTNEVFDNSVRLLSDRNDLKLSFIRYVSWLLPTIGFIGTVIGISLALVVAAEPPMEMNSVSMRDWMSTLTGELGYAFDTTLLALAQSAIIVFVQSQVQAHSERVLIDCEEYCLNNLINKLLDPRV
ncbi:MotA/TolQ/ExbB proton channel family protein [Porticoccaceae bacterium]|nr:MotA/TolQ/ExbB proton channel family protein [Porticoccaceae bacterium]